MYGDAHRLHAALGEQTALHRPEGAVGLDAQHRDLVAARIDGEQKPPIVGYLERPLRADGCPRSGATSRGRENRA
jgi:hypothetical protein